jgi:hypothetical protein
MDTIREIFNEVQFSSQAHKLCVKKLAAAINTRGPEEQENITFFLNGGIDRVLVHAGNSIYMDRSISFLCAFLSTVDENVLLVAMKHIGSRLQSSNKLVRQRVCLIVCGTLDAMCEMKKEMSNNLFIELSSQMISRLKDKVPAVRVSAVKALKYLQFSDDADDECTLELKRCMCSDTSAAVRVAAVEVLSLTDSTKHDLCSRLKDLKAEVRAAVLYRLTADTDMRQFTVQMRGEILRAALEDREEVVRTAVMGLIWKWLSLVDNSNIPKFLNLLNPAENEDAALLVGATLMEELIKKESTQQNKLKRSMKESFFKWEVVMENGSGTVLTPSDVLWVQIRCSYARQFLPVFPASELCDALLPDAVVLCAVLNQVKQALSNPQRALSKNNTTKAQFTIKYLLSLAPLLIGMTDISGLTQLMEECADCFLNPGVVLPWDCVETSLRSYADLHAAAQSSNSAGAHAHHTVLQMAGNLREQANKLSEEAAAAPAAATRMNEENEEEDEEEEGSDAAASAATLQLVASITERCLQLTQWALQQELAFIAPSRGTCDEAGAPVAPAGSLSAEVLAENVEFVMHALQQPQSQVRFLALGCLGLLGLIDAKICDLYRGLVMQVASGDFEGSSIRAQALQCLVDFSVVYPAKYKDDAELANVLLRLHEAGQPESMLVAAEAAAKLLHAGAHHEPRLFANLLKFFFLTESLPSAADAPEVTDPEDAAAVEEAYEHRLFLANCARLQQMLSIFFHVFTTSDLIPDQVVAGAVPYLVADMTNEIKDGAVDPSALSKIMKHLISLCESKTATVAVVDAAEPAEAPLPSMLHLVQATTAASLAKELLKLSATSKVDKAIDKEFVKLLGTLGLESWVTQYDVSVTFSILFTDAMADNEWNLYLNTQFIFIYM